MKYLIEELRTNNCTSNNLTIIIVSTLLVVDIISQLDNLKKQTLYIYFQGDIRCNNRLVGFCSYCDKIERNSPQFDATRTLSISFYIFYVVLIEFITLIMSHIKHTKDRSKCIAFYRNLVRHWGYFTGVVNQTRLLISSQAKV